MANGYCQVQAHGAGQSLSLVFMFNTKSQLCAQLDVNVDVAATVTMVFPIPNTN